MARSRRRWSGPVSKRPPVSTRKAPDADAAAALEAKHAQWEAAEAIRSAMPVAPTGKLPKGEEKQGLLAM